MRDVRGRGVPKGAKSLTARSPQGRRNTKMLTHACDSRCGQRRAQQLLAALLAHSAPCRTQRPSELSAVRDFAPLGTPRRTQRGATGLHPFQSDPSRRMHSLGQRIRQRVGMAALTTERHVRGAACAILRRSRLLRWFKNFASRMMNTLKTSRQPSRRVALPNDESRRAGV
jgi:hypothetical protein